MTQATRQLLLMRHAKSSWSDPTLRDHDRPLNRRGRDNAPMMGRRLQRRDVQVDAVLSSTANRAQATARAVAAELGHPHSSIESRRELYHASAESILSVVHGLSETQRSVILFGHNPGFHDCVERLGGLRVNKFRTAAVAAFAVAGDWSALRWGQARLIFLDDPRQAEE